MATKQKINSAREVIALEEMSNAQFKFEALR
jgi:hypothetical protein